MRAKNRGPLHPADDRPGEPGDHPGRPEPSLVRWWQAAQHLADARPRGPGGCYLGAAGHDDVGLGGDVAGRDPESASAPRREAVGRCLARNSPPRPWAEIRLRALGNLCGVARHATNAFVARDAHAGSRWGPWLAAVPVAATLVVRPVVNQPSGRPPNTMTQKRFS